jgi:hypothetical protein
MIGETKVSRLIEGVRGSKGYDRDALVDVVLATADAHGSEDWIAEMEANPVVLGAPGEGAVALDLLIVPRD